MHPLADSLSYLDRVHILSVEALDQAKDSIRDLVEPHFLRLSIPLNDIHGYVQSGKMNSTIHRILVLDLGTTLLQTSAQENDISTQSDVVS